MHIYMYSFKFNDESKDVILKLFHEFGRTANTFDRFIIETIIPEKFNG